MTVRAIAILRASRRIRHSAVFASRSRRPGAYAYPSARPPRGRTCPPDPASFVPRSRSRHLSGLDDPGPDRDMGPKLAQRRARQFPSHVGPKPDERGNGLSIVPVRLGERSAGETVAPDLTGVKIPQVDTTHKIAQAWISNRPPSCRPKPQHAGRCARMCLAFIHRCGRFRKASKHKVRFFPKFRVRFQQFCGQSKARVRRRCHGTLRKTATTGPGKIFALFFPPVRNEYLGSISPQHQMRQVSVS